MSETKKVTIGLNPEVPVDAALFGDKRLLKGETLEVTENQYNKRKKWTYKGVLLFVLLDD